MEADADRSEALLSSIVSDVALAVTSTQTELDRLFGDSSADLPVAFILRQTEVALVGTLSLKRVDQAPSLTFSQANRVQAGLRGDRGAALSSLVSVSILALEPSRRGR